MNAETILIIIGGIAKYGLPAIQSIIGAANKWGNVERVPKEAWETMFAEGELDYWDVVDKPEE